jgi:hypothetical protein
LESISVPSKSKIIALSAMVYFLAVTCTQGNGDSVDASGSPLRGISMNPPAAVTTAREDVNGIGSTDLIEFDNVEEVTFPVAEDDAIRQADQ